MSSHHSCSRRRRVILVACICGMGGLLLAQESTTLVANTELPVDNEKATDFVMPIVTDGEGNIYARYANEDQPLVDSISKISPTGKKLLSFNLANLPGLAGTEIGSFSVFDGKLVVLAKKREGLPNVSRIVIFGLDGKLSSSAKVDADIQAGQIAALSSNRFIIAGRERTPDAIDSKPKTVIVNSSGLVSERVSIEGDIAAKRDELKIATSGLRRDSDFETSLVASTLTTADDGNVYLMRQGKHGLVFVISPGATVIRRFALAVPPKSSLQQLKVAKGRMAALFILGKPDAESEAAATFVRTYDVDSGKLLASYVLDPTIPNLLAAYDGGTGFTLLGPKAVDLPKDRADEAGRLYIFQVGPK